MGRLSLGLSTGVALLAAIAIVAGCGGGDDGSSGTLSARATSQFSAAFVKQGNEICHLTRSRQVQVREIATDTGELNDQMSKVEREGVIRTVTVFPYVTMIDELGALEVASEEAKSKVALIEAFEERLAELKENPDLAWSGEPSGNAVELAGEYGLTECQI